MFWFNCSKLTMFSYIYRFMTLTMFSCLMNLSLSLSLSLFVDQFSQFSQFVRICHNFHNFLLRERSFIILWFSLPFPRGPFVLSPVWEMGGKICGPTSSQHSTGLVCVKLHICPGLPCPALACPALWQAVSQLFLLHCVVAADIWFMLHSQHWGK